jgi:hypothetical protein
MPEQKQRIQIIKKRQQSDNNRKRIMIRVHLKKNKKHFFQKVFFLLRQLPTIFCLNPGCALPSMQFKQQKIVLFFIKSKC